jgi:GNAT superfamily N-acetyltransferase
MSAIVYNREPGLSAGEFLGVLRRSGLAERRPVDDIERIAGMLANANLVVTARDAGTLVGVARSVTDFAYCCYCSDLAVDAEYLRRGIAQALLDATRAALHPNAVLLLIAAPAAISYYEHIGMERFVQCFGIRQQNRN